MYKKINDDETWRTCRAGVETTHQEAKEGESGLQEQEYGQRWGVKERRLQRWGTEVAGEAQDWDCDDAAAALVVEPSISHSPRAFEQPRKVKNRCTRWDITTQTRTCAAFNAAIIDKATLQDALSAAPHHPGRRPRQLGQHQRDLKTKQKSQIKRTSTAHCTCHVDVVHPCMRKSRLDPVRPETAVPRHRLIGGFARVRRSYLKTSNFRRGSSGCRSSRSRIYMQTIPRYIAAASCSTTSTAKAETSPCRRLPSSGK